LSAAERHFFREAAPFGFILFARNCDNPEQLRRLTDDLRSQTGRDDTPILIDQEGGRVQRLKPPHWRDMPAAARFGKLAAADLAAAERACWLNARLLADDLRGLGFAIDCVPCLDLGRPETHAAIGDRAFSADPAVVAALGRSQADGLLAGGILPVMKHLPGHGRATVDSHKQLPRVETEAATLAAQDFAPFAALADLPLAMTAHVLFTALDPARPATQSAGIIARVIREEIGFRGLLLSDDLDMQALQGDIGERVGGALAAGCDVVLQCNGKLPTMQQAAQASPAMTAAAWQRWRDAAAQVAGTPAVIDRRQVAGELDELLAAA